MRDPNRIMPLLLSLGALWQQYPDMRLGQLLFNLLNGLASVEKGQLNITSALVSIEDDRLLELLEVFRQKMEQQNGTES